MRFHYCELAGGSLDSACDRVLGTAFKVDVAPCQYATYPEDSNIVEGQLEIDEFQYRGYLIACIVIGVVYALSPCGALSQESGSRVEMSKAGCCFALLLALLLVGFACGTFIAASVIHANIKSNSDIVCHGSFDAEIAPEGFSGDCANRYWCNGVDVQHENEEKEDQARVLFIVAMAVFGSVFAACILVCCVACCLACCLGASEKAERRKNAKPSAALPTVQP